MPVKKRKEKARQLVITDEMVALYRRCKELRPTRDEHLRGTCPGPITERCADCRESIEKSLELHRLLGLMPWDCSPIDTLREEERPQPWLCAGQSFDRIREIKRQLEAQL
jgi:hypothetical protein